VSIAKFIKGQTYMERNGFVIGKRWEIEQRWTTGRAVYVRMVLVNSNADGTGLPKYYRLTRRVVVEAKTRP
jgi:hypothetical protein